MSKLFSKINDLTYSFYFEEANQNGEDIITLKYGVDDFRNAFHDYIKDNSIDILDVCDDEFDACVELLEDSAKNSQNKLITFSISN